MTINYGKNAKTAEAFKASLCNIDELYQKAASDLYYVNQIAQRLCAQSELSTKGLDILKKLANIEGFKGSHDDKELKAYTAACVLVMFQINIFYSAPVLECSEHSPSHKKTKLFTALVKLVNFRMDDLNQDDVKFLQEGLTTLLVNCSMLCKAVEDQVALRGNIQRLNTALNSLVCQKAVQLLN